MKKNVKSGVMKELIKSKGNVCPLYHQAIMEGEGKILVEATDHPDWASGLPGVRETMRTSANQWPGKNWLGNLMAEVREEWKKEETQKQEEARSPSNTYIIQANATSHSMTTDDSQQHVVRTPSPQMQTWPISS